ncbi:MAG: CBS domain-containing protein [Ferruginibacter sp.]
MVTVADILKSKESIIISVLPDISVYEAIKVMGEKNIGALLVMEDEKLKGILSERDYARKVVLKERSSRTTLVKEIMTEKVITVTKNDSIEYCMELMSGKKIRHLPVVENEKVEGIISIGDIVTAVIRSQQETIAHLKNYISQ